MVIVYRALGGGKGLYGWEADTFASMHQLRHVERCRHTGEDPCPHREQAKRRSAVPALARCCFTACSASPCNGERSRCCQPGKSRLLSLNISPSNWSWFQFGDRSACLSRQPPVRQRSPEYPGQNRAQTRRCDLLRAYSNHPNDHPNDEPIDCRWQGESKTPPRPLPPIHTRLRPMNVSL